MIEIIGQEFKDLILLIVGLIVCLFFTYVLNYVLSSSKTCFLRDCFYSLKNHYSHCAFFSNTWLCANTPQINEIGYSRFNALLLQWGFFFIAFIGISILFFGVIGDLTSISFLKDISFRGMDYVSIKDYIFIHELKLFFGLIILSFILTRPVVDKILYT